MTAKRFGCGILSLVCAGWLGLSDASAQYLRAETDEQYEARINAALTATRDLWGEEIMASGDASYEKMQGYLRPLYYSAGRRIGAEQGVHNILYARENGERPFFVAICDGSRVAMNLYDNPNDLTLYVGDGEEMYGSSAERLAAPELAGGYYPILRTSYRSADGVRYTQESFASRVEGLRPLALCMKLTLQSDRAAVQRIRIQHGMPQESGRVCYSTGEFRDSVFTAEVRLAPGEQQEIYYMWSPTHSFPRQVVAGKPLYDELQASWKNYWDQALAGGVLFEVPEQIVMDSQRNLLIQNLVLRHRYSMGNNAYDESLYQPEGCDAATALAKYGYGNEARTALEVCFGCGLGAYANWVRGEQLTHSATYFDLTHDLDFIRKWRSRFLSQISDFDTQIRRDSCGLLEPQALSSDIATKEYYTYQQAVAWRGWRDMLRILSDTGMEAPDSSALALERFHDSLSVAVERSSTWLEDGTRFVPSVLYDKNKQIHTPITSTVLGSYWNLCMPYAFDSGFFDYEGKEMGAILDFMHRHGGTLLGMLRFNFYGLPVGDHRIGGIPGYYAPGVDNVYLISYIRALAKRGEVDRLILSFYGRLAHGQTPGTFCSGEGDNIGLYPGTKERCSFGSWNSANNIVVLEALRYMLITDLYDQFTGRPETLRFAWATPRAWLEHGKKIAFENAPTLFGEASCRIESFVDDGHVEIALHIPDRTPASSVALKLRLPDGKRMTSVKIDGKKHVAFDPEREVIDLSGWTGDVRLSVKCR